MISQCTCAQGLFQLASITTSQADQVDLTASDAQETAAHRGRAQLIARIKLLETKAMTAREDADLDRARNSLTIYKGAQQGRRCSDLANELFSTGQQVEEWQRQLARERVRTANLPPDTTATHVEAEPAADMKGGALGRRGRQARMRPLRRSALHYTPSRGAGRWSAASQAESGDLRLSA